MVKKLFLVVIVLVLVALILVFAGLAVVASPAIVWYLLRVRRYQYLEALEGIEPKEKKESSWLDMLKAKMGNQEGGNLQRFNNLYGKDGRGYGNKGESKEDSEELR